MNASRLLPLTPLLLLAGVNGAGAQASCGSDTLTAAAICFGKVLAQADQDMQAKYQTAQTRVKDQSQFTALLAKSQDAFLAYRARTCDDLVNGYWQQGQLQQVAVLSCKVALTRERVTDLDNMFQGLWGLQQ
jgi:uncharacterized protein YecT (DUF1311 family)